MKLLDILNENQGSGLDAILVAGLDNRSGSAYKSVSEQLSLLKRGFGENKRVQAFAYDTSSSTVINVLKNNPNIHVFTFSAGCRMSDEIANSGYADISKLYIIEPKASKINIREIGNVAPASNYFVGPGMGRGEGIGSGASSSNSNSHFGALESVGKIIASRDSSPVSNTQLPGRKKRAL
jgi:hypothetical protein